MPLLTVAFEKLKSNMLLQKNVRAMKISSGNFARKIGEFAFVNHAIDGGIGKAARPRRKIRKDQRAIPRRPPSPAGSNSKSHRSNRKTEKLVTVSLAILYFIL